MEFESQLNHTEEKFLREKLVYKILISKKGLLYSIEEGTSIEVMRSPKERFPDRDIIVRCYN